MAGSIQDSKKTSVKGETQEEQQEEKPEKKKSIDQLSESSDQGQTPSSKTKRKKKKQETKNEGETAQTIVGKLRVNRKRLSSETVADQITEGVAEVE